MFNVFFDSLFSYEIYLIFTKSPATLSKIHLKDRFTTAITIYREQNADESTWAITTSQTCE
jgi:hypothetical protein